MLDSLDSNYGHFNALAFSHSYANFKYICTTSRVPVGRLRTCANAQVRYENVGFEVHYNAVFPYLQSTSAASTVRSHNSLNFLLSTITCTHVHAKTYASTQTHTHTHFCLPPRMLCGRTHPLLLGPVPGFTFEVDVPLENIYKPQTLPGCWRQL